MNSPKLKINLSDNYLTKSVIDTDLDSIPCNMIIYLPLTQEVYTNSMVRELLEIPSNEKLDVKRWLSDNDELKGIVTQKEVSTGKMAEMPLTLHSGKRINIDISYKVTKDEILGFIYFITLHKNRDKASVSSMFSISMIKDEISDLKHNLNSEGKEKLQNILKEHFKDENKQLSLEDLVNYEKELQVIQSKFPVLSRREVLLCGLLINNMDLPDIATITNRSLNSVFVTVHRINKKLSIPNKNELTRILKELTGNGF